MCACIAGAFFWRCLRCHVWRSPASGHLLSSARYPTIELHLIHAIGSSQVVILRPGCECASADWWVFGCPTLPSHLHHSRLSSCIKHCLRIMCSHRYLMPLKTSVTSTSSPTFIYNDADNLPDRFSNTPNGDRHVL